LYTPAAEGGGVYINYFLYTKILLGINSVFNLKFYFSNLCLIALFCQRFFEVTLVYSVIAEWGVILSPDFIGTKDLVVILTQSDSSPDFIGIRMTAKEVILRHDRIGVHSDIVPASTLSHPTFRIFRSLELNSIPTKYIGLFWETYFS